MSHLSTVTYHVSVFTKNVNGAGTDANVYLKLSGTRGESGAIALRYSKTHSNKFENGNVDKFDILLADIGEIQSALIWHDSAGFSSDWMLGKLVIQSNFHGRCWTLPCNQWLANNRGDKKTEREIYVDPNLTTEHQKTSSYVITTHTSDIEDAGTKSRVYVSLINAHGQLSKLQKLEPSKMKEKHSAFARNASYTFTLEMDDIGEDIQKLRIGIDRKKRSHSWHLNKVEVVKQGSALQAPIYYLFECNQWFSSNRRLASDRCLMRDLPLTSRSTLTEKNEMQLIQTTVSAHDECCDNEEDSEFDEDEFDAGNNYDHPNTNGEQTDANHHHPNATFKLSHRLMEYKVYIKTCDEYGASTDSIAFITLYGDQNDSGEEALVQSETTKDLFERGQTDFFTIRTVNLGMLYMIRIRTDGTGNAAAWKLHSCKVIDVERKDEYDFSFDDWLNQTNGFMAYLICHPVTDDVQVRSRSLRRRSVDEQTKYIIGLTLTNDDLAKYDDDNDDKEDKEKKEGEESEEEADQKEDNASDEEADEQDDPGVNAGAIPLADPSFHFNLWVKFVTDFGETQAWYFKLPRHQVFVKKTPMGPVIRSGKPKNVPIAFTCRSFPQIKKIYLVGVKDSDDKKTLDSRQMYTLNWYCNRIMVIDTRRAIRVTAMVQRTIPIVLDVRLAPRFAQCFETRTLEEELKERLDLLKKTTVKYEVTAITGDALFAGTDANVFVILKGQYGTSTPLKLNVPKDNKNYDRMERNTADTFLVSHTELGTLYQLVVWHDGIGLCSGWLVDKLEVLHVRSNQKYVFPCRKWIESGDRFTLDVIKQDPNLLRLQSSRRSKAKT